MGQYFDPIDVDGFQSMVQVAQPAGWYQFNHATAILPLLPITVPPEATGMWIQSKTDLEYMLSPDEAAGNPQPIVLPAGGTAFHAGRRSILNFCARLDVATSFVVQFSQGAIGPAPIVEG